jgi:hypothetical protein
LVHPFSPTLEVETRGREWRREGEKESKRRRRLV